MINIKAIKIIITILSIIIVFKLVSSCNKNNSNNSFIEKKQKVEKGLVTLIFENAPESTFISTKNNSNLGGREYFNYIASFIDVEGVTQYIKPKRTPIKDTINISTKDPKIEIYFTQLGLEGFSYLFLNGDIILITYNSGKPEIKILNRSTKQYDYNFENIREYRKENELTTFEMVFRHLTFPKPTNSLSKDQIKEFFEKNIKTNSINLQDSLVYQIRLLDSLKANDLISKDIYNYYNSKLNYINFSILAKNKELNYTEQPNKGVIEDFKYNKKPFLDKQKDKAQNTISSIINAGDSLFQYQFFHNFLNNQFLPNYVENQTNRTYYNYTNFGGSYYSWDIVFDSIQKSKLYSEKIKQFLLYEYMDKIAKDMPTESVNKYYTKFKNSNTNSTYVDLINGKYQLDSTFTDKLTLKDAFNNTSYLEDILEKNRDKLIYIDFWASWCKPCIDAIPYKNKLRIDYANKKVVFISIAFDKYFDEWKSSKVFKLSKNLTNNFIIIKPNLSKLIKDNHIIFVPRYLLYDQSGKLLDPNAPYPNSKEIRNLFDKHLKNKK
tara:strand:- start:169 stop:1821 length:1653 start_codon:yes stop_codon:yes gene_type:complete